MSEESRLEIIDPTEVLGWDELVACHPETTVFHTSSWARVLSSSYGYCPTYFTWMEEGEVVALLPFMVIRSWITKTRGVSLPFTDECVPILPNGLSYLELLRPVIEFAESRSWKTLEFRGRARGMSDLPVAAEYLSHEVDLSGGEEKTCSRILDNAQRNVRKAEREGVSVELDRTPAGVKEFYRLNCLTRKEHGLPPQPVRFFENLREHILDKGLGTLLLARYRGKPIAGAIFLHFGQKAIYKYGASDRSYQHLRGNNLVFWVGIRQLCNQKFRTLSFGRTDLHHEGLRQFKLSWGATEKSLQYVRYDVQSKAYISTKKNRGMVPWEYTLAKLPIPVLRFIGSIAYRHVG